MDAFSGRNRLGLGLLLMAATLSGGGCQGLHTGHRPFPAVVKGPETNYPDEMNKAILPEYRIEPPDTVSIDVLNVVPKAPYRLRTGDVLTATVPAPPGLEQDQPLTGNLPVQIGGVINLPDPYGSVKVAGMTTEEAEQAVRERVEGTVIPEPVSVSLAQVGPQQQVLGPRLVQPDGRVNLGVYGSVRIVGMTTGEAQEAVREHLLQFLDDPAVSVSITGYNSKAFYVITQGAPGDQVLKFPSTGNETVLDAIAEVGGLAQQASNRIWIARPGKSHKGTVQVLDVDWRAVSQLGETCTNYQLLPGDRLYVGADPMIAFDSKLGILTAPFERIFGFTTFGAGTVTRLSGNVLGGGGNPQGRGF